MQNIWLFQANPDDYDLSKEIHVGRIDDWELNRYRTDVDDDDSVILWQSTGKVNKKKPGIYGFGKLKDKKGDDRINIEYTERLDTPLLKQVLLANPILCNMRVISQYFAANPFEVTANEWQALKKLLLNVNGQ